jgi:hypothetical protein
MGRRKQDEQIDWELVEKEYRLGQKSLRQIAAEFSVQPSAVSRKAKKEGWVQDKSAEVKALSDAQIILSNTHKATAKATPDRLDIEAAAAVRTNVLLSHRTDIARSRSLVMSLLGEVETQTGDPELFDRLGELVVDTGSDAESKLLEAYRRVISTPGRIDGMKKLADSLKTLITLEREAYGLADETPPPVAQSVIFNNAPPATLAEIQQVLRESAAAPKV